MSGLAANRKPRKVDRLDPVGAAIWILVGSVGIALAGYGGPIVAIVWTLCFTLRRHTSEA